VGGRANPGRPATSPSQGRDTAGQPAAVGISGRPVASFTIANTPRYPDKATGEWQDGETWFVRCSAWGDIADNITASLSKGAAVVATGRLRCRTWETDDGSKRAAVEMTVDDLGPSLRRAIAKVTKTTREHPGADGMSAPAGNGHQVAAAVAEPAPAAAGQSPQWDSEPPF
jgi:single-strand DNA-binding protein